MRFKSSSGNIVIHVTDLGPGRMYAAWDIKPTDEDMIEFTAWWKEQKDARISGEED